MLSASMTLWPTAAALAVAAGAVAAGPDLSPLEARIAVCAREVEDTRWGPDNEAVVLAAEIARMVHDGFLPP